MHMPLALGTLESEMVTLMMAYMHLGRTVDSTCNSSKIHGQRTNTNEQDIT